MRSRASLAALAVLLLAGCTPAAQAPPEPSGAELDELIAAELEFQWHYVGLTPDAPRPSVDRVRIVSLDESEDVHRQCMVDAGYDDFRLVKAEIYGGASTMERLAIYTCSAMYPVPPASYGLFSQAQLGYLYDFYIGETVPCLEGSGVSVSAVPTREQFIRPATQLLRLWTPYSGLDTDADVSYLAEHRCPYVPPGFQPF
jgi:hypothetical protein